MDQNNHPKIKIKIKIKIKTRLSQTTNEQIIQQKAYSKI